MASLLRLSRAAVETKTKHNKAEIREKKKKKSGSDPPSPGSCNVRIRHRTWSNPIPMCQGWCRTPLPPPTCDKKKEKTPASKGVTARSRAKVRGEGRGPGRGGATTMHLLCGQRREQRDATVDGEKREKGPGLLEACPLACSHPGV